MLTLVQVTLIVVIATRSALAASPSVSEQFTYDYDHGVPADAATTAHAAGRGVQFDSTNRGVAGFIYDSRVATNGLADDLVGALCSFSGETEVLMADGTTKPISEIEIGDWVLAQDPVTGERGAREVTHLWVHQDTIIDLEIDGHDVATTEDHPFWNQTDAEWQRVDALDAGNFVLTAEGALLSVEGVDWGSARTTTAYNLTIDDLHTYFVGVGDEEVLVHNSCGEYVPSPKHHPNARGGVSPAPTNGQAALDLSTQVKSTSPRRVAYEPSWGEFVVLDQTSDGIFHGHVRPWNDLTTDMQNALVDQGVVNRRGRPTG